MQAFAKAFYISTQWRKARAYIFKRDAGLCVRCGQPGEIVHHKQHLTPGNIDNPEIALGEDNLELLCRDCHGAEHATDLPADYGLVFTADGDLVPRQHKAY